MGPAYPSAISARPPGILPVADDDRSSLQPTVGDTPILRFVGAQGLVEPLADGVAPVIANRSRLEATAPWRVMTVSSSGGVLLELLGVRPWLSRHDVTWVCVPAEDTTSALCGERVHWFPEFETVSPVSCVAAWRRAARLLTEVEPDVVLSAGTGIAVPFFLAARVKRIPCVWLETFNVIGEPGRVARLCSRLAAMTLVQHPDLVRSRPRAAYIGALY